MMLTKPIVAKTKTAAELKDMLIGVDMLSVRKGVYKAKRFFFYTHGMDATKFAASLMTQLPETAKFVSKSECWNAWPKDSWFEVCFTL